jgi:hypothetical protein
MSVYVAVLPLWIAGDEYSPASSFVAGQRARGGLQKREGGKQGRFKSQTRAHSLAVGALGRFDAQAIHIPHPCKLEKTASSHCSTV